MRIALRIIPAVIAAFLFSGCGQNLTESGAYSSATGWKYNTPENGGFEVETSPRQETGPGLAFIQGGTFTMGRVQDDVLYDWNNIQRRVTVSSFYMDKTEVSNVNYREYLYWLDRVFGVNNKQVVLNARPDTLVWRDVMSYNEPYMEYYFRHPSYNEYPVVGVNWEQANDYSIWRTDRVNEKILVDKGYFETIKTDQMDERNFNTEAYLYGRYVPDDGNNIPSLHPRQDTRGLRIEDGVLLPKYRLPTEAEWEFAALGLIGNSVDERVVERRIYPWNGHVLRNSNPQHMGEMRANFVRAKGDMMGVAGSLNDKGGITTPVRSYWPNDYGLYCMAGNVNEWVLDVYRPMTYQDVSGFRPFRGNVFKKIVLDANGSPVIDSLGRVMRDTITAEDAEGRYNYRKADYRNFKDGDPRSISAFGDLDFQVSQLGTEDMYVYDPDNTDYSSLITDEVRVIKGGSWRDRAYWLSPGERRFLKQSEARDDLGFRCAMTRVGSPTGN
ncbi:MAG: SUMF1/EgtB/PvdO family nonheme iron enzyme [Bacteroidales bacterium]|nr:SUMF1/EgtB/PvdO family nonheme iron enzyme [Bacteroidales bacterium]